MSAENTYCGLESIGYNKLHNQNPETRPARERKRGDHCRAAT